jgi:hypothetical protein
VRSCPSAPPPTRAGWPSISHGVAGADDEELVGVLVAVGPAIGFARLVLVAPRLALAIGYDIDDADD